MRVTPIAIHCVFQSIILASTRSIGSTPEDVSNPLLVEESSSLLEERAKAPTVQHLTLPVPPPSMIASLPVLPTTFVGPPINLTTDLTAAQIFDFRVPHSTIELRLATTKPIDGRVLGNALLVIHKYLNDEIEKYGDGSLAPKDDPFVWLPDGPPSQNSQTGPTLNMLPMSLTAASVPGQFMTYGVLLIAVEGLYLSLPDVGREFVQISKSGTGGSKRSGVMGR